ncbi:MAG: NADH-quinone oxidoreductase subunit A [Clostridia bacterium]|jgi:NADH-quinone oxidoreductase subunit A|nr:NADH-quinone oxidoreductase subunit A [Clostridia bacterium]MDH7572853.1 NADH-quinone oxidoreductase subunit A [Clostridia bacterium]
MQQQFAAVGIFFLAGLFVSALALAVARAVRPKRPTPVKLSTYECGLPTQGPTWVQFKVGYFLYALLFLIFDVETVFLYPWAVKFRALGLFAFVEMLVFVGILLLGWWYAWKEGALKWE